MQTVAVNIDSLMELIDLDVFTLFYGHDVASCVKEDASREGLDMYSYLIGQYPDKDINFENSREFMIRHYFDRLSSSNQVL